MSSHFLKRLASVKALAIGTALLVGPGTLAACGGSQSRSVGKAAKEAPKLPPVNPRALRQFDSALRALKLGGPNAQAKAMKRFESALELDDKLWEAWHNLGAILLAEGEVDRAADAFGKALSINPTHRPAMAGQAEAYRLSGNNKKAAKAYRKLIELEPSSVDSYARAASLLRASGDYEDGLDLLREGLRVGGASSPIMVELGLIYLAQGRDELAKLVLGKAVAINDKDPAIYNALALVAMGAGDDQLAFFYFDKAAELDPNYIDTRFNKATVLLDAGDYQGAKLELEAITAIVPADQNVRVALGIAQRGIGEHDAARKTWDAVAKDSATRRGVRSDALFNLAILEMNFVMDDDKAIAALDRYLQDSSSKHSKHKEAVELRKELGE
tara:strand:+ start:68046 stop:69203 length:1158 start_codon:yes stop_codon:yes gene_type:complete